MKMLSTCRGIHTELADLNREATGPAARNQALFETTRQLTAPPDRPVKKIAFEESEEAAAYWESS